MKIGTLRQLRTWCLRKRALHDRAFEGEAYGPMNLYRPRLAGRVEAYDAVLDRIDRTLKKHRDEWQSRAAKKNALLSSSAGERSA